MTDQYPSRRDFLKTVGLGATALTLGGYADLARGWAQAPTRGATRPNIVLLLADDMGFSDIGCYGGEIATPNIDKLAAGGVKFRQFYNNARCCPSRASLLTGLYPHQTGMGSMEGDWNLPGYRGNINNRCVTFAEALKLAGYSTYMSGKWHLTNRRQARTEEDKFNWPRQRGFDRYFGTIAGSGSYFNPATLTLDNTPIEAGDDFYYTDAIANHAVKFIDDHARERADQPFFTYVAFTAPHWPIVAPPDDMAKYRGKYLKGWDQSREERYRRQVEMGLIDPKWPLTPRDPRVPAWDDLDTADLPAEVNEVPDIRGRLRDLLDHRMAIYAAMVEIMDRNVGRIVRALEKNGQLDNTLLLFMSDNGGCAEFAVLGNGGWNAQELPHLGGPGSIATWGPAYGQCWANVSNTPFRLYKHWAHEGGISSPLIVHWPAQVRARAAWCDEAGHFIDMMPTLLDVAGGSYPEEFKGQRLTPLEGISLMPAVRGGSLQREQLCWEHHGNRAIRMGQWKLVANGEQGPWELYDLAADRTELNNLAAAERERVREMINRWYAWAQRCDVLPMNPDRVMRQAAEEATGTSRGGRRGNRNQNR